MSIESQEGVEKTPAEQLADKFVEKINDAATPEELMAAFDKTITAAEMFDIDPDTVNYRHPEGGSTSIEYLRKVADSYLKAAQGGNETTMHGLSDYGLPPEFKEKARSFMPEKSTE